MSKRVKTSFAAGELAPELLGRGDLRAFENGARLLRNVFIQPTGGVMRRPGLRHVTELPGPARPIAFEFNTEQTYLVVLTAGRLQVFLSDAAVAELDGPWTEAMLPQIAFTQSADTLMLLHPDMPPQRVTRTGHTAWSIEPWPLTKEPFYRFAPLDIELTASATSGAVELTASADVFQPGHAGVRFRIGGKRVLVTQVQGPRQAVATVEEELLDTEATRDWDEAAFSPVRGWPVCACFHQHRLVLGGSRDLPNRLWLSRTGDLSDFDLGTGLDDQGIEFALVSDQVNAIRAVFSGRHLQVFTSGAEWMVTGDPLTPSSIQLHRQTRVGSPVDRIIPPVDVDGATIFIARSGRAVHEFAYTEVYQAYQANDLALVARHLVDQPVAMAYDQTARLLHVAMADGSLATVLATGANIYANVRQAEQQASMQRAQADLIRQQEVERQRQLAVQQEAERRARQDRLQNTVSSARARLAAGGVNPDEGSAAALASGLQQDAAADQAESDAIFASRLAAGRRSLLNTDGSLTAWLRAGSSFGNVVRNLLE